MPSLAYIEEKNSQLYFIEYFPETGSELRKSISKRDVRLIYKSHNPLSRDMWDDVNGTPNPIYSNAGIDASNIQTRNESLIIRDASSQKEFCRIDFSIEPFYRWMHCISNYGNIEGVYNFLKEQIENS